VGWAGDDRRDFITAIAVPRGSRRNRLLVGDASSMMSRYVGYCDSLSDTPRSGRGAGRRRRDALAALLGDARRLRKKGNLTRLHCRSARAQF